VRAAQAWRTDPAGAYARLDRARALDPLSDGPDLLAGSIAVRSGDLRRADAAFARALARNPRGSYATLQRGAIASQLGRRAAAVALLARAAALAPRDRLTRYALSIARGGGRVDVARLNEAILAEARQLAG
jgi:tetratricopeptide (TPR) repeat protein